MSHHLVGMSEIAEILGVSRQRVGQLIETYEDFPAAEVELTAGRVWSRTAVETWIASHPERGPGRPEAGEQPRRPRFFGRKSSLMFERFTDRARVSIVKAQEEARLLQHNYIGTEHLVLGLLAIGEGIAWQVLTAHGITEEAVREQIRTMIGTGTAIPEGHIPFTPRSQEVLELALREALQLGHNYVGTEHVLLAIAREGEGVGWQILALRGLKLKRLRGWILEALGGKPGSLGPEIALRGWKKPGSFFKEPTAVSPGVYVVCSFCGKSRTEVAQCIAGTGGYICDECVRLCVGILEGQTEPAFEIRLKTLESRIADLERGR